MMRGMDAAIKEPPKVVTAAIDYDEAVREGKEIVAQTESSQGRLRLGELADQLQTSYGEQTLKRFAKDLGIASCTLARLRSVHRAWAEIEGPAPQFYSVAQVLQAHPNRAAIVKANPQITKRQAMKLMR